MISIFRVLAVLGAGAAVCAFGGSCAGPASPPPAGKSAAAPASRPAEAADTPNAAIERGIALLEKKDYVAFLKSFPVQQDIARHIEKSGKTIEEMAKSFGEDKAASLLEVLKGIRTQKPELGPDGATAKFKVTGAHKDTMSFRKIDGRWHMDN